MNAKYCYCVITNRGKLLLEDHKLPFYWYKKIAKETSLKFKGSRIIRIPMESIDFIINNSEE
jgi:hypothetical protein